MFAATWACYTTGFETFTVCAPELPLISFILSSYKWLHSSFKSKQGRKTKSEKTRNKIRLELFRKKMYFRENITKLE